MAATMYLQFAFLLLTLNSLINPAFALKPRKLNRRINKFVSDLVDEETYNKDVRPNFGSGPEVVKVWIRVRDISSVSEINMDFTVDFYFGQIWTDPRLAFDPANVSNAKEMTMGVEFEEKIWVPNTFMKNSKQLEHQDSVGGMSNSKIKLKHTGEVTYVVRSRAVATCSMNLVHFPADRQICTLDFESFDYNNNDLQYRWMYENVMIKQNITLPTFIIKKIRPIECPVDLSLPEDYASFTLEIYLERSLTFYLYQVYMPSFLIVVISWIPFWLDRNHHARVGLGVTTVLTITTLITNTMQTLPKVSYLKAIDIYLFTCFVIVFLSLIEYAIVGYFEANVEYSEASIEERHSNDLEAQKDHMLKRTFRLDKQSRVWFPAVFILFNLIYFVYIWYVL